MTTLTLVSAIMAVGNTIASAVTGQPSSENGDALRKNIEELKKLALPHLAEETARRADEIKAVLEREVKAGPVKIKVMSDKRAKKTRRRG